MQKVLRINLNARNQALKKARRDHLKNTRKKWAQHDDHLVYQLRVTRNMVKTERKERREDWVAGPLAPKRDVGLQRGKYGTFDSQFMQNPEIPDALSEWPTSKGDDLIGDDWKGKGNRGNLVEGDRVCVIRGPDAIKGQIGKIKEVNPEQATLTIEGMNTIDLEVPVGSVQQQRSPFVAMPRAIPIDDVRLVYRQREEDPRTGHIIRDRDVLVDTIVGDGPYVQREPGSPLPRHTRYVFGSNIEIPWPEVDVPAMRAFAGDTRRLELEKRTYTPSVQRDPLPQLSIIDELRPKYRIDRTAHEFDYVRRKIVEDARSKWYEDRGINTPAMELQQRMREKSLLRAEERKGAGVAARIQILLEEGRLTAFLPSYRQNLLHSYKGQGLEHPELHADVNTLEYQNNSLSSLVDALKAKVLTEEVLARRAAEQPAKDLKDNEEVSDEDMQGYLADLDKEFAVHDAPVEEKRVRK